MKRLIRRHFFLSILFLFTSCEWYEGEDPEYVQVIEKIADKFSKEVVQKYGLHFYGNVGITMDTIDLVDLLYFNYDGFPDVSQARMLVVNCVQDLVKIINDHEKVRPYLGVYPFTDKEIHFRIRFSDKNGNSTAGNRVAYVRSGRGVIFYEIPGPENNQLKNAFKESYSDALRIVQKQQELEKKEVDENHVENL